MLSEPKKFQFIGELNIKRGRLLKEKSLPKDDTVNWLFLKEGVNQWGFVYKIENPIEASYVNPFLVKLSIFFIEKVAEKLQLNYTYETMRGQEIIGTIKLISIIE